MHLACCLSLYSWTVYLEFLYIILHLCILFLDTLKDVNSRSFARGQASASYDSRDSLEQSHDYLNQSDPTNGNRPQQKFERAGAPRSTFTKPSQAASATSNEVEESKNSADGFDLASGGQYFDEGDLDTAAHSGYEYDDDEREEEEEEELWDELMAAQKKMSGNMPSLEGYGDGGGSGFEDDEVSELT